MPQTKSVLNIGSIEIIEHNTCSLIDKQRHDIVEMMLWLYMCSYLLHVWSKSVIDF